MGFSIHTIETVQNLVFPLVKSLTKFDPQAFVGSQSDLFLSIGDALTEIGGLFTVAGSALEDGILTAVEIEAIIAKASTIDDAIDEIIGHFKTEDKPE